MVPAGSMALGVPARHDAMDGDEQARWFDLGVHEYVRSGQEYRSALRHLS